MHLSAKGLPLAVALLEIFGVTDKSTTTDLIGWRLWLAVAFLAPIAAHLQWKDRNAQP